MRVYVFFERIDLNLLTQHRYGERVPTSNNVFIIIPSWASGLIRTISFIPDLSSD